MSEKFPTLELVEGVSTEPPLELQTSLEFLCRIRDQLEETTDKGSPCVVLEFDSLHPLGARIQNHLSGNVEYESIGTVGVGRSRSARSPEYSTEGPLHLQTDREHLQEIAALYEAVSVTREDGPHRWTAVVPPSCTKTFVRRVSELEEQMVDKQLP